jgi:hypothetical protein
MVSGFRPAQAALDGTDSTQIKKISLLLSAIYSYAIPRCKHMVDKQDDSGATA